VTSLEKLEKNVAETRLQWQRAYSYAFGVAQEAYKRAEFICFRAPVRKRYERAVKALARAREKSKVVLVFGDRKSCGKN
jgi:hypothetical protein